MSLECSANFSSSPHVSALRGQGFQSLSSTASRRLPLLTAPTSTHASALRGQGSQSLASAATRRLPFSTALGSSFPPPPSSPTCSCSGCGKDLGDETDHSGILAAILRKNFIPSDDGTDSIHEPAPATSLFGTDSERDFGSNDDDEDFETGSEVFSASTTTDPFRDSLKEPSEDSSGLFWAPSLAESTYDKTDDEPSDMIPAGSPCITFNFRVVRIPRKRPPPLRVASLPGKQPPPPMRVVRLPRKRLLPMNPNRPRRDILALIEQARARIAALDAIPAPTPIPVPTPVPTPTPVPVPVPPAPTVVLIAARQIPVAADDHEPDIDNFPVFEVPGAFPEGEDGGSLGWMGKTVVGLGIAAMTAVLTWLW